MTQRKQRKWAACGVACAALLAATAIAQQTPTQQNPIGPASPAKAAPAASAPAWKTYKYPSDGFSASFPSEPNVQKQTVPTSAGNFELRAYLAEDGTSALYVGVCDYGDAAKQADTDTILDGAKNGAVANVGGHVLSTSKITLGTYPGVTFEAENDTLHFSAHIYIVGGTLYQVIAARPIAQRYAGTSTFLDSFQLIARPGQ